MRILIAIIKGFLTYIPYFKRKIILKRKYQKNSCHMAKFCYKLWIDLLVNLKENNIVFDFDIFGELGNGRSLGIAYCALLSGSKQYVSLEIEGIYTIEENLLLFDQIVVLFEKKEQIYVNYPQLNLKVNDYKLREEIINSLSIDQNKVIEIRKDIKKGIINSKYFKIIKSWENSKPIIVDFLFSRATMEHVNNPAFVYKKLTRFLDSNSMMFHDIEFHSHKITKSINGHYKIPVFLWNIIKGKRNYFLNRWKLENHIEVLIKYRFKILDIRSNFKDGVLFGSTILSKTNNLIN